ncbi:MAG: Gfo/Idh/MocA family oxidoreductase [Gemmatimonadales bacterium]|jgi:predicted dehydrogenase|nr:Gfo/Idh/MocA family oxidoreductase [Gemmatimonadales bacterium]
MSDRVRVGVVGAGAITQVAHLPVLKRLKQVEVVAICDPDVPKARALATRFGVADVHDDIEELLRHAELDAVVICSPNHLHESHGLAALSAGLHVLVERPLALTAASAQKLARAAERRDRVLVTGLNHRYRPDVQLVRSFVQSGELGDVDSVRGSWHLFRPSRQQAPWRQRRDTAGGGVLLDLGLGMLDLGLWLAGNPTPARVSAAWERPSRERGVEHSGSAFVVCENGTSIFFDVTWHHVGPGERFGMGLRASKGSASVNPLSVWKELHGVPTDVSPTGSVSRENAFTSSYRAEWAHFLAAMAGEAKAPDPGEQVQLLRVMEAIYRSADEGRDVAL